MAISKSEVMEWIDKATMLEISDLVKSLEEKYGISAAAAMPVMMGAVAGAAEALRILADVYAVNQFPPVRIEWIRAAA